VTVASQLKQLPKVVMLDMDMLLIVAMMVRLAQTWALLSLPVEFSWTLGRSTRQIRSRYRKFWGVTSSVFRIQMDHTNCLF
jgi:hypothetical protein